MSGESPQGFLQDQCAATETCELRDAAAEMMVNDVDEAKDRVSKGNGRTFINEEIDSLTRSQFVLLMLGVDSGLATTDMGFGTLLCHLLYHILREEKGTGGLGKSERMMQHRDHQNTYQLVFHRSRSSVRSHRVGSGYLMERF